MNPSIALVLTPLIIWAGVFAFIFTVDRRIRALERQADRQMPLDSPSLSTASAVEKETLAH